MPKQKFKKVKKTGLSPGSLIFTGKQKVQQTNITLKRYSPDNIQEQNITPDHTFKSPANDEMVWYDIRGVHDVTLVEKIGAAFQIHPLVLEDVLETNQRPKLEEYENGIFLVVRALSFDQSALAIHTEQVAIYFSNKLLISFQEDKTDLFEGVRTRITSGRGKIRSRGADYLAYALIDNIVDYYFDVLDKVEEEIDRIEDEVLTNPGMQVKSSIHQLKRELLTVRKSVNPLREAISRFSKAEHDLIDESSKLFLRDLHDHIIQIMDMVENYRDTLSGLQDLYLSELSYKMNSVMQMLTIIATIFIPLSFLAGVYGMNFDHIPELHWQYSYYVFWGVIVFIIGGSLYYFRRKGWL